MKRKARAILTVGMDHFFFFSEIEDHLDKCIGEE